MKSIVKNFGQFVNEAKFYHALPQGETRLRDQYQELSAGEQDKIQNMAKELDELNILREFKKGLSKYKTIAEVKKAMKEAMTEMKNQDRQREKYNAMSAEDQKKFRDLDRGWKFDFNK